MKKITEHFTNLNNNGSFWIMLIAEAFIFFDYVIRDNQPSNILMLIAITSTMNYLNEKK